MLVAFFASLAFYYFYNKFFFAFAAHSLDRPAPRPIVNVLTWLFNFSIFLALTLPETPLFVNWALIGVLLILETKVLLRTPWINSAIAAIIGALVGLCSTMIMRSSFAIALSIPLSMVNSTNTVYKALPIAFGFLLAAFIVRCCDTTPCHRAIATILTQRRVIAFVLPSLLLGYLYLCANLLLYNNELNEVITKIWSLKSVIFVSIGTSMAILFGYRLASVLAQAQRRETLACEIAQDEQKKAQLLALAEHDALTGCFNRWYAESVLAKLLEQQKSCLVVFIDVDNLKIVNDHLGHEMGDTYIASVADALDQMRASSSDIVARFGGDEFLVILPNAPSETALSERMNVVSVALKDTAIDKGLPFIPSFSWGFAFAAPGDNASTLIERADSAMYDRKRHKKDLVLS